MRFTTEIYLTVVQGKNKVKYDLFFGNIIIFYHILTTFLEPHRKQAMSNIKIIFQIGL